MGIEAGQTLLHYRLVEKIETIQMPTDFGTLDLHLYRSTIDGQNHIALVKGSRSAQMERVVRALCETTKPEVTCC